MTTEVIARRGVADVQSVDEKARKAVSAFRSLQPTLTAYARILSGKQNVRVECSVRDNGSTDGTSIYYRPPLALGDNTPHVRSLCDKRGENGLQQCSACAIREEVLCTIYHEIAHICFNSFAQTTPDDKRRAIQFAVREAKGQWARQIEERINNAPSYKTRDYINLVSLINEYLPFLLNCLEDARVNRELFKARPGVKKMFGADTSKIFAEGFENRMPDGSVKMVSWQEAPLNSQAMIGVFCKASGYDYSNWFHPRVVETLDDSELTRLVKRMDTIRSAGEVYNLSFQVLARLRDLGFCGTPQDPDPEPQPEENNEQQDEASQEPQEGSQNEGSEGDQQSSEAEPGDSGDQDPQEGTADSDEGHAGDEGEPGDQSTESVADAGSDESEAGGLGEGEQGTAPSQGDSQSSDDSERGEGRNASSDEASNGELGSGDADEEEAANDNRSDDNRNVSGDVSDGDSSDPSADSSSHGADGVPSEAGREEEAGSEEVDSEASSSDVDSDAPAQQSGDSEGQVDDDAGQGETESGDGDLSQDESRDPLSSDRGTEGDSSDLSSSEGSVELGETGPDPRGQSSGDDESSLADTGADDGYGGTDQLNEVPEPPMGSPDEVDPIIKKWGQHEEKPKALEVVAEDEAIDKAIIQGIYFNKPSENIHGVREHLWNKPVLGEDGSNTSVGWGGGRFAHIEIPDAIIAPALLHARRAFTDNQRNKLSVNRKSGRVNANVLGRRAWSGDPRLFSKKTLPGKKDYFVVIGMDISGSTVGLNLHLEKRAIMAQADLLDRAGIPFAIYAHTGQKHDRRAPGLGRDLDVYHIKESNEPWIDEIKLRLESINSNGVNLDGHFLEYLRKKADRSQATNKIVLYYSDGKMPSANHDEELEILQSEIKTCRAKNYLLLGVGIRTDSPRRHGLSTVQVDEDEDLVKVVEHLERGIKAMD